MTTNCGGVGLSVWSLVSRKRVWIQDWLWRDKRRFATTGRTVGLY